MEAPVKITPSSIPRSYLDTDTALTANSDNKVATQKAVKAYADTKVSSTKAMVYPLFGPRSGTPSDGTTYYFGRETQTTSFSATPTVSAQVIHKSGTITSADINFNQSAGTAETSTVTIEVYNAAGALQSTTTLSAAVVNNATSTRSSNFALTIAATQGWLVEFKWITPTWATNPTGVLVYGSFCVD